MVERAEQRERVTGPVERELARVTDRRARGRLKAQRLVEASPSLSRPFQYQGVQITILDGPKLAGDLVAVTVSARQGRTLLPVDNPYLFVNPPILVPDGTYREVVDPATEQVYQVPNHKENLTAALQAMIGDAVLATARRRGWRG